MRREREIKGPTPAREVLAQLLLGGIEMNILYWLLGRDFPVDERDPCKADYRCREFDRAERRRNDPCDFLHTTVLADRMSRAQQRHQL